MKTYLATKSSSKWRSSGWGKPDLKDLLLGQLLKRKMTYLAWKNVGMNYFFQVYGGWVVFFGFRFGFPSLWLGLQLIKHIHFFVFNLKLTYDTMVYIYIWKTILFYVILFIFIWYHVKFVKNITFLFLLTYFKNKKWTSTSGDQSSLFVLRPS